MGPLACLFFSTTKVESAGSSNRIVKFDEEGRLVDEAALAAQAGIEPNVVVRRTKDGHAGIIKGVSGGKVTLVDVKDKETTQDVSFVDFKADWVIVMDRAEIADTGMIVNHSESNADNNEPLGILRMWSQVQMALVAGQSWIEECCQIPAFFMSIKAKKVVLQCDAEAPPFRTYVGIICRYIRGEICM
jgi:hypothetical protein